MKSVAVGINSDVSIETLRSRSNCLPYSILRLTNRAEVTVSKRGLSIPSLLNLAGVAALLARLNRDGILRPRLLIVKTARLEGP